jgi:hypothetical protein
MSTIINATTTNGVVIQPDNSGSLVLQTNNGTTALTIDTSQNVGIGTSSFAFSAAGRGDLEIAGSSTALVGLKGGSNQAYVYNDGTSVYVANNSASGNIVFQPASYAERMRIDSSGRVTMPYQPAFFVIANGSYTVGNDIVYNEVSVNRGSHYNSSSGRFTAPVTGLYYFSMKNLQNNTSSVIRFYFVKNGTVLGSGSLLDGAWQSRFENSTGNYKEQQTSSIIQMNAGDYITVRQIAGSASIDSSGYSTFLGYLLG